MSGTGGTTPTAYLERLADHLDDPERHAAAAVVDSLRAEGPVAHGAEAWVEDLAGGDPAAWGSLLAGLQGGGEGLRGGVGARLLALSPFAGNAFVTVDAVEGGFRIGGDLAGLLGAAMREAGHEPRPGDRFVLAVDPRAVSGGTALCARVPS